MCLSVRGGFCECVFVNVCDTACLTYSCGIKVGRRCLACAHINLKSLRSPLDIDQLAGSQETLSLIQEETVPMTNDKRLVLRCSAALHEFKRITGMLLHTWVLGGVSALPCVVKRANKQAAGNNL